MTLTFCRTGPGSVGFVVLAALTTLAGCGSDSLSTGAAPLEAVSSVPNAELASAAAKDAALRPVPISDDLAQKSKLGVNLSTVAYWSGERSLANLVTGSGWINPDDSWASYPLSRADRSGNFISSSTLDKANRILTPPVGAYTTGVRVRCTFSGKGRFRIAGAATEIVAGNNSYEFTWPAAVPVAQKVWLELSLIDPVDPVRNIDCRETDLARSEVFAPEFLDSVKPYGVIRFLDWSKANENLPLTWATRTLPNSIAQTKGDGVALEHIVALANTAGSDPWLTISWNADADYIRRTAEYVRDNLAADRRVYVELSNEVWNGQFPVAAQAQREGLAAGLSSNAFEAQLFRYAEKATWALDIWKQVFASQPDRLVRVLSSQHANDWTGRTISRFRDTKDRFDALATAPYFSNSLLSPKTAAGTDLTSLLERARADAHATLADMGCKNAATAATYNKRYIAYEAGQHMTTSVSVDLLATLNRDPRIGEIYDAYLADWNSAFKDVMMLYNSTGSISQFGAWGLREFSGQPIAQTPKRRAAIDASKAWTRPNKASSFRCA